MWAQKGGTRGEMEKWKILEEAKWEIAGSSMAKWEATMCAVW